MHSKHETHIARGNNQLGGGARDFLRKIRIYLNLPANRTVADSPLTGRRAPIADICGNEAIPLDVLLNIFDKRSRIIFFVFFPNLLNSRSSHHLAA